MKKKYILIPSQIVGRPGMLRNKKNLKRHLARATKKKGVLWLHSSKVAINKETRTVRVKIDLPNEILDNIDFAFNSPIQMSSSKEALDKMKTKKERRRL